MFDGSHYKFDLLAQRFVFFTVHFLLIDKIKHYNLSVLHGLPDLLLQTVFLFFNCI